MPDGAFPHAETALTAIKPSRYTVLVPLRMGRRLACNTVTQAFAVWDAMESARWADLVKAGSLPFVAPFSAANMWL
ncbi:hypothetical protein [Chachezhania sediminis]|uniref:hypothetical protein n=1 Tax=Chachezhania sediminis TaxID=2599291 RepID=UPI00131E6774|nr:hypothetical protein [Chachezhania sediminis]